MNIISRPRLRAAATAVTALLIAGFLAACGASTEQGTTTSATVSAPSASATDGGETLSYPGRTGATALDLLQEADPSAEVSGTGENAFVTAIGGRAADDAANEFWALSVDGEPAQVGAGTLETEDGQEITWTLETY